MVLKRFIKNQNGNVTMMFAGSALIFMLAAVGGLDSLNAYNARNSIQQALDAAVLAGVNKTAQTAEATARDTFSRNLPSNISSVTQSYAWATVAQSDPSKTVVEYGGQASFAVDTTILSMIGLDYITVTAKSKAQKTSTGTAGGPCIYALDTTGSQALLVNSGATVKASSCELHVHSKGNPAAMFNSGSSLTFSKICVAGSNVTKNSVVVNNLATNCAVNANPYAGKITTPSSSTCTYSNLNYSGTVTLNPGVYCGWFNFNSGTNVKFNPGTYVIKSGGWNVNGGTFQGDGVTFYFADTSKIQFNSGMTTKLTAPTSGTYKDILFFENESNTKGNQFIFNDSVENYLKGVIYLPTREVVFNAASKLNTDEVTLVSYRLILNNTTWNLKPLGTSSGASTGSVIRLVL